MSYSDITFNDPNPIKRYLQKKRLNDAINLYPLYSDEQTVLDFGCGDGELALRLEEVDPNSIFICYEPTLHIYEEAKQKLKNCRRTKLINSLSEIPVNSIDVVFSLEVFEHLPNKETNEAIEVINSILKPGGTLIVGVPNEIYFAALYKGLFRMFRRYGEFDANLVSIIKCALGKPPSVRPKSEISPGINYHFHHLGFDHRLLELKLNNKFLYDQKTINPLRFLSGFLSPEVYFEFKK